ncbi:MAG: hypothetical protein IT249_17220 [Chitinophagaceae bacterium]|nr:hypothetical protein [Chitinophagaceae bacterium]
MKLFISFLLVGFLAISCNNTSDNTNVTVDSANVAPAPNPSSADTTVTDPITRTDSTKKADTAK